MKQIGIPMIWGIPNSIKPIDGLPPGKARFKFRKDRLGKVYVKTQEGLREYRIIGLPSYDRWTVMATGANLSG